MVGERDEFADVAGGAGGAHDDVEDAAAVGFGHRRTPICAANFRGQVARRSCPSCLINYRLHLAAGPAVTVHLARIWHGDQGHPGAAPQPPGVRVGLGRAA
ncbi:hypothetical protein GCM10022214_30680 [Actinomadura miaoliensis]|uniref:Uncharacterized protein n=1 Tax=Actinomadura miaoliensis TaxID=430685 RepID=A0ABP7VQR3_9ACTN